MKNNEPCLTISCTTEMNKVKMSAGHCLKNHYNSLAVFISLQKYGKIEVHDFKSRLISDIKTIHESTRYIIK